MERKALVRSLVALNAVLLCVLVWLLVTDKKAANKPVKLDGLELADSLESSDSSCVYEPLGKLLTIVDNNPQNNNKINY
ncbi:MAG: hypothetical protein IJ222_00870 [Bacteroidales bacterium]|nr:hypothetical protein [Bacteroidales bacterium]